jgi:hypothetical protein
MGLLLGYLLLLLLQLGQLQTVPQQMAADAKSVQLVQLLNTTTTATTTTTNSSSSSSKQMMVVNRESQPAGVY